MSIRPLLIPLALLLLIQPAKAQVAPERTTAAQPQLVMARIDEEGRLAVKMIIGKPIYGEETREKAITKYQTETRTRKEKVTRDGQIVEEERAYTVQVPYVQTVQYTVKVVRLVPEERQTAYSQDPETKGDQAAEGQPLTFFETNGEKVPSKAVAERLKDWQVILITSSGKPAEDYYTYLFKPGTLVTSLPPAVPIPQPLNGQAAPAAPKSTEFPPTFAFAKMEGNRLSLRTIVEETETEKLRSKADQGQENAPARVDVESITRTHHVWRMGLDAVDVMTAGGETITGEALASRLPRETTVLITRENRPIDKKWLKNVRPETLVISTPLSDAAGTPYDRDNSPPIAPPAGLTPGHSAPPAAQANEPPRPPEVIEAPAKENKSEDDLSFLSKGERDVFDRTNQERAKAGKPPLKASPQLSRAARGHAENMAKKNNLSHTLDGTTFDQRIRATGYQFSGAGENISNVPTAASTIDAWLKSPGHRRNMLNEAYTEIGIGQGVSSTGENYWVQVFATPFRSQAGPSGR